MSLNARSHVDRMLYLLGRLEYIRVFTTKAISPHPDEDPLASSQIAARAINQLCKEVEDYAQTLPTKIRTSREVQLAARASSDLGGPGSGGDELPGHAGIVGAGDLPFGD